VASERLPTGRMIRAARALVGLDQAELAREIGVDRRTMMRIEAGIAPPTHPMRLATYRAIRDSLERRGVSFVYPGKSQGEGVTLKKVE